MNESPDRRRGWWAIVCALSALIIVIAAGLQRTPTEVAADRLRVGMTPQEVAEALRSEVAFRSDLSWPNFSVLCSDGLRMTFRDGMLTDWWIGPRSADEMEAELSRAKELRFRAERAHQ